MRRYKLNRKVQIYLLSIFIVVFTGLIVKDYFSFKIKNVELLDNGNEILYPRTVTEQVAVTANQNLKEKLNEMEANIESVTNEVKDARTNSKTTKTHLNLKERLDDLEYDESDMEEGEE